MARKKKAPETEQQILDKMRIREKLQEAFQRGVESLRTITHYTTLEGFRSIITNNQLWVSNIRFLNDRREMDHGLSEATKFLDERASSKGMSDDTRLFAAVKKRIKDSGIPSAYACCFCEQNDSLGQWRGYTGGTQGIAIEFYASGLRQQFKASNATLQKVIYGQDETRRVLEQEVDSLFNQINGDLFADVPGDDRLERFETLLLQLAPRFKHKSFEDEREWRLIISEPARQTQIEYRTKDNVLVPYIKLGTPNVPLPINRIRIGPGKDMDITLQSVELFLRAQLEYDDVDVVKSAVPFRT
ncbi:DUF2971 domain-containing protein [Ensifer sp. ENS12]|uniref:DUF2971 domain-containing protein n=1 Tax=Ensifer sp. ENS12 TaxID=2854774 RepID=UPI001C449439|nr:DUF2971 domain-containing protein [Ensifer sp. ENS12]MBV7518928.1 DUF2971 domain-containing protein [Ensifer sp. ENS12]